MLDVGCGEGHAVRFFHNLGLYACGIDGLRKNVENAVAPVALHDLLSGPFVMPVDFVWSCEVAEHIGLTGIDNYLNTLVERPRHRNDTRRTGAGRLSPRQLRTR